MNKNLIIRISAAAVVFLLFAFVPVGELFSPSENPVPVIINPDKSAPSGDSATSKGFSAPSGDSATSKGFSYTEQSSYTELKKEQKDLAPMSKDDKNYSIQAQVQDESGEFQVISFSVDPAVVEELGFTETEVRNACEAAGGRARRYIESFVYNGTPELRSRDGNAVVVIPILVDNVDKTKMFISGKVTKSGQALPMRATREDEI